jgi:Flp pilus assembly protein TadG
MQRLRGDRGAVSVVVALLMVPLLGFAAIAIDVSAMYAERQQLQTGADAGALAIAQDCGRGVCGTPSQTAQGLATDNLNRGVPTATVTSQTASQVTVRNVGVKQHWFAPVLGVDSSTLTASATAAWGSPTGGTAVLPLAFSLCEWRKQTGGGMPSGTTPTTIYLTKSSASDIATPDCTGPSGNLVPGGFGWLTTNAGSCQTTSTIGGILNSDPGNSVPSSCSNALLSGSVGNTVLLPLFDVYAGSGSNATYTIYGYAAFRLTGYHFGGQNSTNPAPCNGEKRCISGYFTKFVDISEAFTYGAGGPQLGASIVRLTK